MKIRVILMDIFTNFEYKIYNNLINNLYKCSNCEEFNLIIAKYLPKIIPVDSSIFMLYQLDGITARSSYVLNLEEKRFLDYQNYYQNFDLYKEIIHQMDNPPVVNRASDYIDYNEWDKNEHRADFLIPQDIYHITCMEIIKNNKILASLSLHRSKQHNNFNDKELFILKLLAPLIKNIYQSFQTDTFHDDINKRLTPREKQILPLLTKNYSTQELSTHLAISKNTVKTHIRNILRKANCNSRFELTVKIHNREKSAKKFHE